MVDVTLLELNVDGIQLSTGGSDSGFEVETGPDSEDTGDDSDSGRRPWLAAVVGLLFLVVLAGLAKRRLGEN